MCYKEFKPEWDVNIASTEFKKKVGVNAYIYYTRT